MCGYGLQTKKNTQRHISHTRSGACSLSLLQAILLRLQTPSTTGILGLVRHKGI